LNGDGVRSAVELLQGFHDLVEDRGRCVDEEAVASALGAGLDFGGAFEVLGKDVGQVLGGGILDDVGTALRFHGGALLGGGRQGGQRQQGTGEQALQHGGVLPARRASGAVEGESSRLGLFYDSAAVPSPEDSGRHYAASCPLFRA